MNIPIPKYIILNSALSYILIIKFSNFITVTKKKKNYIQLKCAQKLS